MAKEVLDALDQIEVQVNEIVTLVETLKGLETDEESYNEDVASVKRKLDSGTISKASFDKITALSRQKLGELKKDKSNNWNQLISTLNTVTDVLAKIKDKYQLK